MLKMGSLQTVSLTRVTCSLDAYTTRKCSSAEENNDSKIGKRLPASPFNTYSYSIRSRIIAKHLTRYVNTKHTALKKRSSNGISRAKAKVLQ